MFRFISNTKSIIRIIFILCLIGTTWGRDEPVVQWGHQLLTPTMDSIRNDVMVIDINDCLYIVVSRMPKGAPESASKDQYLIKFDRNGEQLWSKQLGKDENEEFVNLFVNGLVADDKDNLYALGYTNGKFGRDKFGDYDAFIASYDRTGTRKWVWQLGTTKPDVCTGLDVDASGNIYIAGYTYGSFAGPNKGQADMFVAAYDRS
jgi:hypothetical protein